MTDRNFHQPGRSTVIAANGVCATSHPLAAKVAISVLEDGGNAVDAAIAGAVLLGICEPQMTGLGGDCFALISPGPGRDIVGMNASGRAPAATDADAARAKHGAVIDAGSPEAVTVPGAVAGFCMMSADWGTLGLDRILAPAIRYADEGVPVAPRVALDWRLAADWLKGDARTHFLVNGAAPSAGTVFRAPAQAEVMRRIAKEGRDGFYKGDVANDMVSALRALGGVHTEDDFAACTADYVDPIAGTYRGTELVELPPNGQGATAILMANMLAGHDIAALDPLGAERVHLEAEITKLAYDARNRFVADPDHSDLRLAHMLSRETAASLNALIKPDQAMPSATTISETIHKDTIYITVVDRNRMAVSLIYSIFNSFGSGLASRTFGIGLQNRGAGFTLQQGHPNELAPGKRPLHTIIPAMLRQGGEVVMPYGVMGGGYQPAGHARVLSNIVDYGMHPQAAIDAPRAFAEDGALCLEDGYSADVAEALSAKGHKIERREVPLGGAQAIWIDAERGVLLGASDPRKDGCALGY